MKSGNMIGGGGKMKYKGSKVLLGIIVIIIVIYLYLIGKLMLTNNIITKSLFREKYYAKVSSNESDTEVFRKYMETKGWSEVEVLGGLHIFKKGNETKKILNTDIKTITVDGKLNF